MHLGVILKGHGVSHLKSSSYIVYIYIYIFFKYKVI